MVKTDALIALLESSLAYYSNLLANEKDLSVPRLSEMPTGAQPSIPTHFAEGTAVELREKSAWKVFFTRAETRLARLKRHEKEKADMIGQNVRTGRDTKNRPLDPLLLICKSLDFYVRD